MLDVSLAPPPAPDAPFEDHIAWARTAPVTPATPATLFPDGLEATPVAGRLAEDPPPWDYPALAKDLVTGAGGSVLDVGTGDGELFAGLAPLPAGSAATESGHTFLAARRRLEPLGVDVRQVQASAGEVLLPFFDARYSVVLSRFGAFDPVEVARVLAPGGTFCTEQIDSRDGIGVAKALGLPLPWDPDDVTVDVIADSLVDSGLEVAEAKEHAGTRTFKDLATVLWYLRVATWLVPGLAYLTPAAVARHEAGLRALHLRFAAGHELVDEAPRILVTARKPA
ncbi:class I SAM-dependent methyltransferase [Antribacter gilvus]|uniref:class I SAM-dependent methyltransferase n=1 Tax=Antribacter gilvus TaxID=2304675 RepID=UPI000F789A09|nr:class I SAM-dependent methyltransferase [Antribacter gilvus]